MIRAKLKPPSTRRTFANRWGELDYLCKKIRFWLYSRKQTANANRYLDRLEQVLGQVPENEVAIIRHEGLALLHELKGEIGGAIAHRKKEIALMDRLHKEAQSPNYSASARAYMLRDRDDAALMERRVILESLQSQVRRQRNHVNGR
jgi:hypothetical protein